MDPQPLEDFLPYLNVEVDGVPRIYMLDVLRQTCIEFCQQTLLVRETLPAQTLSADVSEYELEPSLCDSEVARVLDVFVNGARISPVTPVAGRNLQQSLSGSAPTAYYCATPGVLTVVPTPSSAVSMVADVAIMPQHDADNVPSLLYTHHRGTIVRGAAARLLLMPKRPWSSIEHGGLYRKLYWNEMHGVAKSDHWDGYGQPIHRPGASFL